MAKLWVKSWVVSLDKPKIMSLPADQFKCWQVLQWIAGRYNRDGLLPPIEECAFVMHVDADKARTMMTALRERGLLDVSADGWRLHDWSDWQEVAEWETREAWRERKQRQRAKQKMSQDVTRDTVTVTDGHGNVTVSHDKKEIEKEIEKDPPVANATSPRKRGAAREEPADGFAEFYADYPRHDDRQEAVKAWNKLTDAQRRLARDALPTWLACEQWQTARFVPMAATFLNQHRFENAPVAASPANGRASPNAQYKNNAEKTQDAIARYAERITKNGTAEDHESVAVERARIADRSVPLDDG